MVKIIAELCQNHCGDRTLLREMVAAAAENGADIIKIQTIFSEDLTHRQRFDEGETTPDGTVRTIKRPYTAEHERLAKLDITEEDHRLFIEECQRHNVIPMTTVFARHRIPFVASLPWPQRCVKVASYDCASFPLLLELCAHFDHLIVSTGATFDEEIVRAAQIVREQGKELTFLHCVTSYPNALAMCNLARMEWLRQFTPSVGWSDHTLVERDGIQAAKVAIACGAQWVERHFTILPKDRTKDGPVSITPALLRELRVFADFHQEEQQQQARAEIREWDDIMGETPRPLTHTELLNRDYYRGRFASRTGDVWLYNWEEKERAAPLSA